MDGLALRISPAAATFSSLPLPLAQRVFLALPPDARGRASCVCRAWRDALADPSLWTRLDMTLVRSEFHAEQLRYAAVLCGAAGRARRQLRELDLSQRYVSEIDLLPVLTANAGSLRELHLSGTCHDDITKVVAAAPLLQVLKAEGVACTWYVAPRLLRAEPPAAALQMLDRLTVDFQGGADTCFHGPGRVGPVVAALADTTLQPKLSRLHIVCADVARPTLMAGLVDAALARRLRELMLVHCAPPAAAPLARLLTEGSLDAFISSRSYRYPGTHECYSAQQWHGMPLLDATGVALVADALRVNTTLTKLDLFCAHLCEDVSVAGSLLGALVGHPRLRELRISGEEPTTPEGRDAFGASLAALIAADAPALQVLECSRDHLDDAGLTPIVEALARNRHLRELNVGNNGMSEAFARERLLPAVRANTTLRELNCAVYISTGPAAEAQELVRCRGQHG
jgi:hypothetical protein